MLNRTKKRVYLNRGILPEGVNIRINRNSPSKTELEFSRLFQRLDRKSRRLASDDITAKLADQPAVFSRMLSKEDVVFLGKRGAEIGSHCHSHAMLPNIDAREIEFELTHSKKVLEDLCGKAIDIIAFPQGAYNDTVLQKSIEAGYKYLLLADDKVNVMDDIKANIFHRIGLYHKGLDENLAKVFGFHQAIACARNRIRI